VNPERLDLAPEAELAAPSEEAVPHVIVAADRSAAHRSRLLGLSSSGRILHRIADVVFGDRANEIVELASAAALGGSVASPLEPLLVAS
jgi:hypothetical protein